MAQENALIVIEELKPAEVFTDKGAKNLLALVTAKVDEMVYDLTTAKGRAEITGVGTRIVESKKLIDQAGVDFLSPHKKAIAEGDPARKIIRDGLDALKKKNREPLTEWEEAEEIRKAEDARIEQERIHKITNLITTNFSLDGITDLQDKPSLLIQGRIRRVAGIEITSDVYCEFEDKALDAKELLLAKLDNLFNQAVNREEAERKRQEEGARLADEREKLEQEKAELKAQQEKAAAEQAERDRIENERQEKIKAEDAERQAAEDARQELIADEVQAYLENDDIDNAAIEHERQLEAQREQEEADAKAAEERAEAMRPDKEKLVAFSQQIRKHFMLEAGKIDLESDTAHRLMSGLLENIDFLCSGILDSCERL